MKNLLFLAFLGFTINTFSQTTDKTVTLVVSGQGKTQDEAKQNALRSAIEQAFGTFISSKTEILNDDLVKDEIVSVASGNIQKYEIISEVQIPNGDFATSLNATVSVDKLTAFVESKGVVAEFKGNLFAFNIKQQILNEQSEILSIENMINVCSKLMQNCFVYQINALNPISDSQDNQKWIIPINIQVKTNQNIENLNNFLFKTLSKIALSNNEINDYETLGKKTYNINYYYNQSLNDFFLRTEKGKELFYYLNDFWYKAILNIEITNGIKSISGNKLNKPKVQDDNYLNLFSDRSTGKGYGWYDLILNPNKINSKSIEINEQQILGIHQVSKFSNQGSFGIKRSYTFIFPDSGTLVGNIKYSDYFKLEELNRITEFKVSPIVN
jgi:predicted DNA-binding protein with PD1-like motif